MRQSITKKTNRGIIKRITDETSMNDYVLIDNNWHLALDNITAINYEQNRIARWNGENWIIEDREL